MKHGDPMVEVVRERVVDVLAEFDRRAHLLPDEHVGYALGTTVRTQGLLRSGLSLVDSNATAGLGALVRVMYDEWLFVVIMTKGADDDRLRLGNDYQFYAEKHAKAWGMVQPQRPPGIVPKAWSTKDKAARADELWEDDTSTWWYDRVHRLESFVSVHGGVGALVPLLQVVDGRTEIVPAADNDNVPARFGMALLLAASVGHVVWEECGLDTGVFERAIDLPVVH